MFSADFNLITDMILVLGGTTEGRKAVEVLDKAGKPYYYSTKSELQNIESPYAIRISGGLDFEAMKAFCSGNGVRLIIDAAHPFADQLHQTVAAVAATLSIPAIRYERIFPPRESEYIWCDDYADAVTKLQEYGIKNLLALTGVQTITKLADYWHNNLCHFRILRREESFEKARKAGFPESNLLFYENEGDISDILDQLQPDAIITKESGKSGGFSEKVTAAFNRGIKVFVIARPATPEIFESVTGEYGLRKGVEKHLPDFFELHSGFTTGACATAAAKAALLSLTEEYEPDFVTFTIPDGEVMGIPVSSVSVMSPTTASATVIKDAGDDPDVTDGCSISAEVRLANHGEVHFFRGDGVGIVTLPGIGIDVGQPAINPVPRAMISRELLTIYPSGCDVTISVAGGEELAKKTFNPRIGIVGGISIIGTSGIVMPFSNEAFIEAIRREMEVALASGCERVVLNSGARSERVVKGEYPNLSAVAFVHYGNAIGESLSIASELGIGKITVGLMLGKGVKLAEGNMDTHSHKVTMNKDFLIDVAQKAGCSNDAAERISSLNLARELWKLPNKRDVDLLLTELLRLCLESCRKLYPAGELTLLLIDDEGEIRYRTQS